MGVTIMRRNTWIMSGVLASGTLALFGMTGLEGQSVEAILRASERLELTEQQVQQLDAIRREAVEERSAALAEMAELRSRLDAGQIERSDLMAAMEDQRDAARERGDQRRERIDAVLTDTQRGSVQRMRRDVARRRSRGGPQAGRGFDRGDRGGRPGLAPRRPGVAPRGRREFAPIPRPGFDDLTPNADPEPFGPR